jgi:hypothetical protein
MRWLPAFLLFLAVLVSCQMSAQSAADLNNKDIIELVKAGITADVLVEKIKTSPCDFDTSPDSLKALKAANVPDSVILAMVKAPSAPASSGSDSVSPASPTQPEPTIRTAKVTCLTVSEVPLLRAPGDGRLVQQVKCGADIAVLLEQDSWVKVRTLEGAVGFLADTFVSKSTPTPPPAVASPTPVQTSLPLNVLHAIAWRAVPWATTSYYQTPGNASTQCTGSGSWSGNIWQGNSSCSSQYTPAQTVPVNWQHVTIYNLVETSNARLVLACTRNWSFSKCSHLVPGNTFQFEMKNGKIEVFGHKGGNSKEVGLSFDVMSSQAK